MKKLVLVTAAAAAVLVSVGAAPAAAGSDAKKVTICHVPPGNPGNAHTIVVSENALPAHLAHGDTLGPCTYPPRSTALVAPSTVAPGASFDATLQGCAGGESANFVLDGKTTSGLCNSPAAAGFRRPSVAVTSSATVTLVAPTTPGTYTIVATGATSGLSATAAITVVGATPGGGLPATGSDSAPTVQVAAGLFAIGAGLTVVGVRRRKTHA